MQYGKKERENISLSKALSLLYLIASGNNKWFTFFKKLTKNIDQNQNKE